LEGVFGICAVWKKSAYLAWKQKIGHFLLDNSEKSKKSADFWRNPLFPDNPPKKARIFAQILFQEQQNACILLCRFGIRGFGIL